MATRNAAQPAQFFTSKTLVWVSTTPCRREEALLVGDGGSGEDVVVEMTVVVVMTTGRKRGVKKAAVRLDCGGGLHVVGIIAFL